MFIDKNGVSDPWKYSRIKKRIDYKQREKQLLKLLEKHRGKENLIVLFQAVEVKIVVMQLIF